MNDFIKQVIEEKFASKAQQRYFYAKANEKGASKKEKKQWKKWASEFSSKTDFDEIPDKVEKEEEIEEIVDDNGNIKRGNIPLTIKKSNTLSKKDSDAARDGGFGSMGKQFGQHGTNTSLRYWAESDLSKLVGSDAVEDDLNYDQTISLLMKKHGMDKESAEKRAKELGMIPGQKELVRLVENPGAYLSDYIESVLSKKTETDELVAKDDFVMNPIISKQIESLKKSCEKNNIPLDKVLKHLKGE
jgi:uncharacterized protein YidB (DUF937 family)